MDHLLAIIVPPVIGLITYAILQFLLARSEKQADDVALQRRLDRQLTH